MSAILSADDLNDFISPGVACIKPVETLPQKGTNNSEEYEVTTEDKVQPETQSTAQISLTDCLACSGCVTSAEAVLISLQSHSEVLNTLDAYQPAPFVHGQDGHITLPRKLEEDEKIFIASVSPQVRASLAATFGVSETKAGFIINQFLGGPQGLRAGGEHQNGFTWVVDTDILRQIVLTLTAEEAAQNLQGGDSPTNKEQTASPKRPILSSACPGWICYAEKTHPYVLPHLSRLKSPQALAGTFLKSILSRVLGVSPSQIWHLAIMPCFDKKLEASREELTDEAWSYDGINTSQSPVRDVDCVITSRELLMLASTRNINLSSLPLKPLSSTYAPHFPEAAVDSFLFAGGPKQNSFYGSSGGYLYYVLSSFQARHPGSNIITQRGRNSDVLEYSLVSESGQPIIKAARYYGFRNIQNLVRRLKPARTSRLPGANRRGPAGSNAAPGLDHIYVEVMACPGGCTNGGGQIRIDDAREANSSLLGSSLDESSNQTQKSSLQEQRAWLARIDEAYYSADDSEEESEYAATNMSIPDVEARVHGILKHWTDLTGINLEKLVYTTFRKVESDVGKDKSVNDTSRVVELAGKIGGGW